MPSDTSREARDVQIELLRRATPSQRLGLALRMTDMVLALSKRAIRRANPRFSEEEVGLKFIELNHGPELAQGVREYLEERRK